MSYSALQIANAFLSLGERDRISVTNMKLQKLLYFAQGHWHSLRGKRLIREDAEAWQYGPVYHSVWQEFRRFGARPIESLATEHVGMITEDGEFEDMGSEPIEPPDDPAVIKFIDAVWNAYKNKDAIQLSNMSHASNGPWDVTRKNHPMARNAIIPDSLIAEYFKSLSEQAAAKSA